MPGPRPDARLDEPDRRLFGPRMLAFVWLPIAVITALHYGTGMDQPWAHDILRRCYYLPIVIAAFLCGLKGALTASLVTSGLYLPHAFLSHFLGHHHHDPAGSLEKILEVVLYNGVAAAAGYLAELERRRRSELRRALEEQQRLIGQLVQAGRLSALGQVVAGITHEIKNPLHALAGTAEIVDPLIPEDAEERRMWEIHVRELRRLQRVAERFLSFAKPGPSALERLDLRDVARRLRELIDADARGKGIRVELELPSAPVPVLGDRDQLASVALNIAVNAFAAIGARAEEGSGGVLRIAVAAEVEGAEGGRAMAALRLDNDGPPLAEAERARLFDPFYSGRAQGTGLGLAIAARIADQHGGVIDAENGGLGVVFTLRLPRAGDHAGLAA
ncbi:MAG: histidine kinase dimerization/phospho-acceptor domain-containing protein [Nannocystaceae bacterium]